MTYHRSPNRPTSFGEMEEMLRALTPAQRVARVREIALGELPDDPVDWATEMGERTMLCTALRYVQAQERER